MRGLLALSVLISLPASAQWQTIFLSSQVSVESSKISTSLAQAERVAEREKRKRDEPESLLAECQTHVDCEGYCIKGRCVEALDEQEAARVEEAQPPPLETPKVMRCSAETACAEGQSCVSGYCLSPPPPPSSLLRRSSELYVRHNVSQLRQDLALGEGPVITTLARMHGIEGKELGPLMRAHREELTRTLGDVDDVRWPARFFEQLRHLITLATAQGFAQRPRVTRDSAAASIVHGQRAACELHSSPW